jgi:hypothetical protein
MLRQEKALRRLRLVLPVDCIILVLPQQPLLTGTIQTQLPLAAKKLPQNLEILLFTVSLSSSIATLITGGMSSVQPVR